MQLPSIRFRGLTSALTSALTFTSLLCLAGAASAQFTVSRFTIDCGGGAGSAGGPYAVSGTVGQPDAGSLSGASFALSGGFWLGGGVVSGVEDDTPLDGTDLPAAAPLVFRVYPASPNPVGDQTVLTFDLPEPSLVRASLFDASGRLVRVLADEPLPAGRHQRTWNRRDRGGERVPAGIYFVTFEAGTHQSRQKVVIVH